MYQEPDLHIGKTAMVDPKQESEEKYAGTISNVGYIDYVNDFVYIDAFETAIFPTAALLVLKPPPLLLEALKDLSGLFLAENGHLVNRLSSLVKDTDNDSAKQALRLAYDTPELRAAAVITLRHYVEEEYEQYDKQAAQKNQR